VLQSVSRLAGEIVSPDVERAGQQLRSALSVLREKEDLVAIGAYQHGSDPVLDTALAHRARIEAFLRQRVEERSDPAATDRRLIELGASLERDLLSSQEEIPDAEEVPAAPGVAAGVLAASPTIAEPPAIPALGLSI
jgi:flagellum-specific ATP synthase